MSEEPAETQEPAPEQEPGDLLVKILIPAAVALVLLAAGFAERGPATRDLQLVAPGSAYAGQIVPVRATFLDLAEVAPEPIAGATVSVVLRGIESEGSAELARAALRPSKTLGYVGELQLPADLSGPWQLFATGHAPGREEEPPDEARRRITIGPAAEPPPRRGRLQTELQRFELGPRSGSSPPSDLEVRVPGGDCTNHAPCRLLVWVGQAAASVELQDLVGARAPQCEDTETTGIVACRVSVRGNEANAVVVATRSGAEAGRRRVQLPMGSPAPSVLRERALVPVGHRPAMAVAGHDEHYVVDLFHEGFWTRSTTLAPDGEGTLELPWALDAPGLWRAQVRRDVFGSNSVAALTWWASEPGQSEQTALRAIASHPRQNDWMDPLAAAIRDGAFTCAPSGAPCEPDRIAAFLLAAGELQIVTYPRSSSGAEQASIGLRTVQWWRRGLAAGLIFLAGLLMAFVVHRRARRAGAQAAQILAAGREPDEPEVPRRPDTLPVASAAFLVLIFALVAAIVLARGCILG